MEDTLEWQQLDVTRRMLRAARERLRVMEGELYAAAQSSTDADVRARAAAIEVQRGLVRMLGGDGC